MKRRGALGRPGLDLFDAAFLFVAFVAAAWAVYEPILDSGFVSDDWVAIGVNPYVQELSLENLRTILDPYGPAIAHAMNYAPVHLLLHAIEIEAFGDSRSGFHVVNLVLHALSALTFTLLLVSSRIPAAVAAAAGAVFLMHPAHVETVAMIFQAKTLLSTGLAFGALLLLWRHPLLGTLLFALALLTKFSAVFALPVAVVWAWVRSRDPESDVPHWGWLALWALVLVSVAVPEFWAFKRAGQGAGAYVEHDLLVHVRSIVGIAARYLVMAATSLGLSAFHQPQPASSWLDPWWLAGAVALPLLAWRAGAALVHREEEAAWWILAVAAFAPVSQVFPFPYPMADRYLYTILPGLLGAVLLASRPTVRRLDRWLGTRLPLPVPAFARGLPPGRTVGVVVLLALATVFGMRTRERVFVFRSEATIAAEAARNYPDGIQAWIRRAEAQARGADAPSVARSLEEIRGRGFCGLYPSLAQRVAPVAHHPEVRASLEGMATCAIERLDAREELLPYELLSRAQAQIFLGDLPAARDSLQRALDTGPAYAHEIRIALRRLRARMERGDAGEGSRE